MEINGKNVKVPKGYHKPKRKFKARRSPIYIPTTTETRQEATQWLRPRKSS